MNKKPDVKHIELDVTNFGPIAEAKIQMRPLTVFVGPSNTGKSYLAILIYALHRFFAPSAIRIGYGQNLMRRSLSFPLKWWRDLNVSDEEIAGLLDFGRKLSSKVESKKVKYPASVVVPESIASLIRPAFENLQHFAGDLDDEIRRCFGVDEIRQLIRRSTRDAASVTLRTFARTTQSTLSPFEYRFFTKGSHSKLSASISSDTTLHAGGDLSELSWALEELEEYEREGRDMDEVLIAIGALWRSIYSHTLGNVYRPAHYLPADRTGVMHAHRVVVRSLIEGAPTAGLRPTSPTMPALSGVMADFLAQLMELDDLPRARRRLNPLLDRGLEENVLAGAVDVKRSDFGYPHFFYTPRGWKDADALPLMNASSMVSELAPVVLFLRHVVSPGDLLIIEEPESHLHPAMQAEFARQLALVVKAGIRVLVTTHSEWILDQFANLVRMSDLPESRRKGLRASDAVLGSDQFGAWLFKQKQRPKGSVVEEIRIEPEVGGLLSDYSEVAEQLYNTWAEIGNRVTENE